jgi:GxxExxY protein
LGWVSAVFGSLSVQHQSTDYTDEEDYTDFTMGILNPPEQDSQTRVIIGAAMQVHRFLGPGFAENVYQEALAIEFGERGISYHREASFAVVYRGQLLQARFRVDFVCFDQVLVELKASQRLTSLDESQVINYLKASGRNRALLLNFGERSLVHRRFVGPRRESV